jgi:hypothetical protein
MKHKWTACLDLGSILEMHMQNSKIWKHLKLEILLRLKHLVWGLPTCVFTVELTVCSKNDEVAWGYRYVE